MKVKIGLTRVEIGLTVNGWLFVKHYKEDCHKWSFMLAPEVLNLAMTLLLLVMKQMIT